MEALFGGAAGPGKSSALLMAALQYVHIPGYSALLLRRTYRDLALPGALIPMSHEWLGGRASWRELDHTWTFPTGATLTFGYLEHENDKYRYQSTEFDCICWDELTQFTESQYRYLFSRLRRKAGSTLPLRVRAASNPGGVGHDWVKLRFIGSDDPNRVFLPAKLSDNPHIDQVAYVQSLGHLDPITRQQLLNGDWSARQTGGLFRREWFTVVDAAPAELRRVRYWDLAATDPKPGTDPDWTAGCLLGLAANHCYYVLDVRRIRGTPAAVEALIRQCAVLDGKGVPVWIEQEPGASGVNTVHYYVQALAGWPVRGDRHTGSKIERANPLSSQAEAGNIRLVRGPWISAFLDELEAFPNGPHDDQIDAFSGAFDQLAVGRFTVHV